MRRFVSAMMLVCGGAGAWAADPVPDFKLRDASDHSSRQGAMVSPRDYILQVSGYYFGAAG